MGILYEEGRTEQQQDDAHQILSLLTMTYPGHPWAVRVDGGVIFIRLLDPFFEEQFRGPVGMNLKNTKIYSASQLKKEVVNAAGQLLEMLFLPRGRENGSEITKMDGAPREFYKKVAVSG